MHVDTILCPPEKVRSASSLNKSVTLNLNGDECWGLRLRDKVRGKGFGELRGRQIERRAEHVGSFKSVKRKCYLHILQYVYEELYIMLSRFEYWCDCVSFLYTLYKLPTTADIVGLLPPCPHFKFRVQGTSAVFRNITSYSALYRLLPNVLL